MTVTKAELWPANVPHELQYPEVPLHRILGESAEKYPDRTAIIFYGTEISYYELDDLAWRFATYLRRAGFSKGDRVALFLPNCPQFVVAFYGTLRAGGVVVPCNPLYKERELAFQLKDSSPAVLVALDMLYHVALGEKKQPPTPLVLTTSVRDYLPPLLSFLAPLKGIKRIHYPNTKDFNRTLKETQPEKTEAPINPREDLAVLQYTGGTTGTPKGAMLTHYNLLANTTQIHAWSYGAAGADSVLCVLPFFHIYGLTVALNFPIKSGATMILFPRFEAKPVLKAISRYHPNYFPGVPAMYTALVNRPDIKKYDISSIRSCLSGAAALPVEILKKFESLTGATLVEGYGLTEASPVTHANPLDEKSKRKEGSIGVALPDTVAKIVDMESGRELQVGEVGELVVRGPQVMKGYWNSPGETKMALHDGWLHTGDIAKTDADGYFYIVERKKDMIDVAGFKAWPREIEEVLYEHPAVKEAAVIGVPDPRRGEAVKAFVILKEDRVKDVTGTELQQFCKQRLAGYKVPQEIEFVKELPRSMIGKVLRRVLREQELAKISASK